MGFDPTLDNCTGGSNSHSTASHGGFRLSADRNRAVHPLLRADDGFYEEDCLGCRGAHLP
ncbi:DUF7007 domain-containing protein [Agrobacterium tumefaciens]|uniref:DUF7007 domain-containing protein n=1 Tax=Agrobacterium tumefaciens TaxID=358 RepID=UPI0039774334